MTQILTAQTEEGKAALNEIMTAADRQAAAQVPPQWVRVLIEEGEPVSLVAIDPDRRIEFPGGDVRYAFLCTGHTRADTRSVSQFCRLLEATFSELREIGCAWLFGRIPYSLGESLGFATFSSHSAFELTPEDIEQTLGGGRPDGAQALLTIETDAQVQGDLCLVSETRAKDENEAIAALREAAWVARSIGKLRILLEHPPAAPPGSRYPIHPRRDGPLMALAMTCGARVRLSASEPDEAESGSERAALTDMVRLLNLPLLLRQVLPALAIDRRPCPSGSVAFKTDRGKATLAVGPDGWQVSDEIDERALRVPFPADCVAQMVTGYRSARTLAYSIQLGLGETAAELLDAVFPRFWRFSRCARWVYP